MCAVAATLLVAAPLGVRAQQAKPQASADEGVARGLFQAGKAAYEQGRFAEALEYFERAYEQSRRPLLLYNIGQAADRLRKDERALEAFRAFIELAPSEPERAGVEARIRALEQAVAARQEQAAEQAGKSASIAPSAAALPESAPASSVDSAIDGGPQDDGSGESVWSQWWLWTGVGVLVAGGVTAALLLSSDEDKAREPIPGELGGVVQTLAVRWP